MTYGVSVEFHSQAQPACRGLARAQGYPQASSAMAALDWLVAGHRCDLAILDMQMPDLDGLQLAAEIRRLPERRALPLVLLTSLGWKDDSMLAVHEFAAFLTKPIKPSKLFDALARVFAGPVLLAAEAPRSMPEFDRELSLEGSSNIIIGGKRLRVESSSFTGEATAITVRTGHDSDSEDRDR
jgi:CheY-like chemotaxis protein